MSRCLANAVRPAVITFVFDLLIVRPWFSLSASPCSRCCISAYEYVVGEAKMTDIFSVYLGSLVSQRNMFSSAAINSLRDMISPCRTPLLLLILLHSVCRWTVIGCLYSMYTFAILCSWGDVSTAWVCTESKVFSYYNWTAHRMTTDIVVRNCRSFQ